MNNDTSLDINTNSNALRELVKAVYVEAPDK